LRLLQKQQYPKNWKTVIVPRIRARSGDRCECTGQCGAVHVQDDNNPLRCEKRNGDIIISDKKEPSQWGSVVLTVMHLNHQPDDCRDENLLHGCQACHNRYDAPVRAANLKARRMAALAVGDLFKCEET